MSVTASQQHARIISILGAAEHAGLTPMPLSAVHAFAYLANVLSPIWSLPPLDGKVLKQRSGPYYPVLQGDLDQLVGIGVVMAAEVGHFRDDDGQWRLRGNYRLGDHGPRLLAVLSRFPDERSLQLFLTELALGLSRLRLGGVTDAPTEDATYADDLISAGDVVDFGEWKLKNFSATAARRLGHLANAVGIQEPAEQLHLYLSHLALRLADERATA